MGFEAKGAYSGKNQTMPSRTMRGIIWKAIGNPEHGQSAAEHVNLLIDGFYQDLKWAGIAAIDGFSELVIIAIPVVIVWPLKMSSSLKFQACSAFFFRLG